MLMLLFCLSKPVSIMFFVADAVMLLRHRHRGQCDDGYGDYLLRPRVQLTKVQYFFSRLQYHENPWRSTSRWPVRQPQQRWDRALFGRLRFCGYFQRNQSSYQSLMGYFQLRHHPPLVLINIVSDCLRSSRKPSSAPLFIYLSCCLFQAPFTLFIIFLWFFNVLNYIPLFFF